jgi:hypothetical protein
VLAHELLDNLPFRLVRDGEEVTVGVDGDGSSSGRGLDPSSCCVGDRPIDGDLVVPTGGSRSSIAWRPRSSAATPS